METTRHACVLRPHSHQKGREWVIERCSLSLCTAVMAEENR